MSLIKGFIWRGPDENRYQFSGPLVRLWRQVRYGVPVRLVGCFYIGWWIVRGAPIQEPEHFPTRLGYGAHAWQVWKSLSHVSMGWWHRTEELKEIYGKRGFRL